MAKGKVGASILSIITESLYDKPIVVFREYIQNSADSLDKVGDTGNDGNLSAQIWMDKNDLFFLDNGTGINFDKFPNAMIDIANSGKTKTKSIGYKGIGRLSGIPYCSALSFINIIDYKERVFQEYDINCDKYREIQKSDTYRDLDFVPLMELIGGLVDTPDIDGIISVINKYDDLFANRNTGFLVVLKDISTVLKSVIDDEHFLDNLGWLLPVPFLPELVTQSIENANSYELFAELMTKSAPNSEETIPAKSFDIFYNSNKIHRPLKGDMLRKYLCKSNLDQYAICVHAFSNKKIEIKKENPFSGIRIYIDNMLLCDENELIPALQQYGLIRQGSIFEVIQAVRGIGAMIYITDKVNISANARRTFIDVTDGDSFRFLDLIGEFVNSIFKARYALSRYDAAKRKEDTENEKLNSLKETALQSLESLAHSEIVLEPDEIPVAFEDLSKTEQKRVIKSVIDKELRLNVKTYLSQTEEYNPETCFSDFKTWLGAN